ncbi:MAG: hypothetical protein COT85_00505 [Chlamydiae bacterium CG10_big_fil_rev_8_21_14_0_10_42_34]|nr:MAG: hypothetical protein COT85_00505 [Chlamydiae bacterium CG10_big_fil_rev_8_21_14_0_10_42_34]
MKITSNILSIPPYISTTWNNISSLHVREERGSYTLIVLLQNGVQAEVPRLDKRTVTEIFEAHARSAEESVASKTSSPSEGPLNLSLLTNSDNPFTSLGASMEHNPEQAGLPPLPPAILKKITMVARAFGLDDTSQLAKAEPHCNCVYCQVIRSLQGLDPAEELIEEVSDEDLKFKNWEVAQTDKKLYIVTNLLDKNEQYNVFLGEPLGCTCGSKNCEHIRAVLDT